MKPAIGIDSIPLALISPQSRAKSLADLKKQPSYTPDDLRGFFGFLCIGVEVNEYDVFAKEYLKAVSKTFSDAGYDGLDFGHPINSMKLNEYSAGDDYLHEAFLKNIKKSISRIHVFYSSFGVSRLPQVNILSRTRHPRQINPKELIISHFSNAAPHICVWKLKRDEFSRIIVDHFSSKTTNAWEEIKEKVPHMEVVFKGDECDPLISTADILLRCLERRINQDKARYDRASIVEHFSEFASKEALVTHGISDYDYPWITPREERNIALMKFLRRPIFFVISPAGVEFSFFLSQPKGKIFLKKVYEQKGSYKLFSPSEDRILMKEGDFIVSLDARGETLCKTIIENAGITINYIDFKKM